MKPKQQYDIKEIDEVAKHVKAVIDFARGSVQDADLLPIDDDLGLIYDVWDVLVSFQDFLEQRAYDISFKKS